MGQEGLPDDEVAVDVGARVGKAEEDVDLMAEALEELLPGALADDEEAKEELEGESPDHVAPEDVAPVFKEDGPNGQDHEDPASRDQAVPGKQE